ncbi:MAG: nucleotidyltransferase family protein [Actinomycetota bacterium]
MAHPVASIPSPARKSGAAARIRRRRHPNTAWLPVLAGAGIDPDLLLAHAREIVPTGVALLAVKRLEQSGRRLPKELLDAARFDAALTLRSEAALGRAAEALRAIPVLVLKGSSFRPFWPDQARRFIDLDLLVHPDRFDQALGHLAKAGFSLPGPRAPMAGVRWKRWESLARRVPHAVTVYGPGGCAVDVHRTLPPAAFGRLVPFGRLAEAAEPLDTLPLRALGMTHRVLSAALHCLNHGPANPMPWLDLAFLLPHVSPTALIKEARFLGLGPALAATLRRSMALGLPVDPVAYRIPLLGEAALSPLRTARAVVLASSLLSKRGHWLLGLENREVLVALGTRLAAGRRPLGR